MKIYFTILILLAALYSTPVTAVATFDNGGYAVILSGYVDEGGLVDYAGLKANGELLEAWVASLDGLDREVYEGWTDKEKIAFWINAYNGLTLKLIVDHYPIESSRLRSLVFPKNSIMQIPGRWKKVSFDVMGDPMTLDEIEHAVLRGKFTEPRIHVALVCAALSCPELRGEPFEAAALDDQLDDQAREFLSNETKFRINRDKDVVYLSAIFDWFGGDFIDGYGTGDPPGRRGEEKQAVLNFVMRYVDDADAEYLRTGDFKIKFLDYDWTLNEQPHVASE